MSSDASTPPGWRLPLPGFAGITAQLQGQSPVIDPATMALLIEAAELPQWLQAQREEALARLQAELAQAAQQRAQAIQQDLDAAARAVMGQWQAQLVQFEKAAQATLGALERSLRPALLSTLSDVLQDLPDFEERLISAVAQACKAQIQAASGVEVFAHPEALGTIQRALAQQAPGTLVLFTPQAQMDPGQWRVHLGGEMLLIDTEHAMQAAAESALQQVVNLHTQNLAWDDTGLGDAPDQPWADEAADAEFLAQMAVDAEQEQELADSLGEEVYLHARSGQLGEEAH